jgi:ubiquinone/menaquinone biosynthesis C-methylase UbiE
MEKPPSWRLPEGVSSSLWDYIHSEDVAGEYDKRLEGSPLFEQDARFVQTHCPTPGKLIDLGCGTGRMLTACSRQGHWVLGVDLSEAMLGQARKRGQREQADIHLLQANLTDLRCLADRNFDYAICLFSTLGMILGDACRQRVVESAHRLLRPGGRLILHVHNRWFSVWDSAGRRWLLVEGWRRMMNHLHAGDRPMPVHQGVAGLSLHHFTRGEAVRLLVKAGFRMLEVQPVGLHGNGALAWPQFLPGLRAYGYLLAGLKVS